LAITDGNLPFLEYLLEPGADLNIGNGKKTPLEKAIEKYDKWPTD
jgi:hypothetical protein